jgi:hypothetical protein
MKMRVSYAGWLLPIFLTACFPFHRTQPQPAQQFTPPVANLPKPPAIHPALPDSALTIPSEPLDTDAEAILEEAAKPAVRHRRLVLKPAQEATDNPPAAEAENSGVSAIGELSSPDPSDQRRETEASMAATERGLHGLRRGLNSQEQKIAAQIRGFLKQARQALNSGDVDGAHTLAAKAQVLLEELSH